MLWKNEVARRERVTEVRLQEDEAGRLQPPPQLYPTLSAGIATTRCPIATGAVLYIQGSNYLGCGPISG
jgi:hypothetical protein